MTHLPHSHSSDPIRPDGTDVKKGALPSGLSPRKCSVGVMKLLASSATENCGMRVSSLVDTTTVRFRVGSTSSCNPTEHTLLLKILFLTVVQYGCKQFFVQLSRVYPEVYTYVCSPAGFESHTAQVCIHLVDECCVVDAPASPGCAWWS